MLVLKYNGKSYRYTSRMVETCYAHENRVEFRDEKGQLVYSGQESASVEDIFTWWVRDQKPTQFDWFVVDRDVCIRINGCGVNDNDYIWLDEVEVFAKKNFFPSLCFHAGNEMFEEDPRQYDEVGKENMRNLLRHLGYKAGESWSWKR